MRCGEASLWLEFELFQGLDDDVGCLGTLEVSGGAASVAAPSLLHLQVFLRLGIETWHLRRTR